MALPPPLLEDEFLVAYDKPAGTAVAAERGVKLADSLLGAVQARHGGILAAVHRLDTEASGVVLFAKDKVSLDFLSGQFQSKTAARPHLALCLVLPRERCSFPFDVQRDEAGQLPDSFTVDLAMDDDPENKGRMQVFRRKGGKACESHFRTIERLGSHVLVECLPVSQRPHQLRVHLACAGAPILNDVLYGVPDALLLSTLKRGYKGRADEKPLVRRLALHASGLTFKHPATREPVSITTPMPEDFEVALKYLRKFRGRD